MRLIFSTAHKSITDLSEQNLPDFVVLTGVNGAGKSHLLQAIDNNSVLVDGVSINSKFPQNQSKPIRLFDWATLVPQDSGVFAPSQITQERYDLWNDLSQRIHPHRNQILDVLRQYNRSDLISQNIGSIARMTDIDLMRTGSTAEQAQQILESIQNLDLSFTQNLSTQYGDGSRTNLINRIKEKSKIPLLAFEEEDFFDNFPIGWKPIDIFQQSFGRLFSEYQKNFINNSLKELANSKGKPMKFLSDEDFIDNYGNPPWKFLNSILEKANLDFRINQPDEFDIDRQYEPILTNRIRNTRIKFADLSSGEKILMSFALCLYYAEDRRQLVNYPKVLLFDEIDAPLHPSMTQSLLTTIQEILVQQHGIKVILTTHSPSTVALSPEESIYAMTKDEKQRLKKVTKDTALSILTSGVPTLSIDYENRRQVFVESKYDVGFYEEIYNSIKDNDNIKDKLISEISISFISSGANEHGNCDQVKEFVNKLSKNGNKTVYGIVDWDLKNDGNDRVKVLGKGKRYSMENYIFDPILLAAFLVRERIIESSKIGLARNEKETDFIDFDSSRMQSIVKFILEEFKSRITRLHEEINAKINSIPDYKKNDIDKAIFGIYGSINTIVGSQECKYLSGHVIDLPQWLLHAHGHSLEILFQETFPRLKAIEKNKGVLKTEILSKVVRDEPRLLSEDFISLFQEIQDVQIS
jgi:ABC-type branched-subunit amino acid transport system ATPase component